MPTIYVSRNGNSTNLKLRDSEGHNPGNDNLTTGVNPTDTVTWVLDPNASNPIASIQSITKADNTQPRYANSVEVLTANPTNINGVWTGYVKSPSVGVGKFENYTIGFTLPNDNTVYYDDPKLQMDS